MKIGSGAHPTLRSRDAAALCGRWRIRRRGSFAEESHACGSPGSRSPTLKDALRALDQRRKNKESLARGYLARLIKSAITYFPAEQYHWRQWLNFCVRDGNRCDPLSMVTDKSSAALSGSRGESACVLMNRTKHETGRLRTGRPTSNARRIRTRKPVDATKSLTVSTT